MSGLYRFVSPAGEHKRFAPGAFDDHIGKLIPARLPGGAAVPVRLVSAVVIDEGRGVEFTFELGGDAAPTFLFPAEAEGP